MRRAERLAETLREEIAEVVGFELDDPRVEMVTVTDVNEVRQGFECVISLVNFNDIKVEDEIEAYVIEKIAATEL